MKILCVCTGNICRSPLAEGIITHLNPNLNADSCAIENYHVGEQPDERSIKVALENNINIANQKARQINQNDFYQFNWILGLDQGHIKKINSIKPKDATAKIALFMQQTNNPQSVPDPYYGSIDDFRSVYQMLIIGTQAWLKTWQQNP